MSQPQPGTSRDQSQESMYAEPLTQAQANVQAWLFQTPERPFPRLVGPHWQQQVYPDQELHQDPQGQGSVYSLAWSEATEEAMGAARIPDHHLEHLYVHVESVGEIPVLTAADLVELQAPGHSHQRGLLIEAPRMVIRDGNIVGEVPPRDMIEEKLEEKLEPPDVQITPVPASPPVLEKGECIGTRILENLLRRTEHETAQEAAAAARAAQAAQGTKKKTSAVSSSTGDPVFKRPKRGPISHAQHAEDLRLIRNSVGTQLAPVLKVYLPTAAGWIRINVQHGDPLATVEHLYTAPGTPPRPIQGVIAGIGAFPDHGYVTTTMEEGMMPAGNVKTELAVRKQVSETKLWILNTIVKERNCMPLSNHEARQLAWLEATVVPNPFEPPDDDA